MLPSPSFVPLFPYTTLFRSRVQRPGRGQCSCVRNHGGGRESRGSVAGAGRVRSHHGWSLGTAGKPAALPREDRKSTRLNSSHLVISYAVFCLKKKKRVK